MSFSTDSAINPNVKTRPKWQALVPFGRVGVSPHPLGAAMGCGTGASRGHPVSRARRRQVRVGARHGRGRHGLLSVRRYGEQTKRYDVRRVWSQT